MRKLAPQSAPDPASRTSRSRSLRSDQAQRGGQASQHEEGRMRQPQGRGARQPEPQGLARREAACQDEESEQRQGQGHRHVARVLLEIRGEEDQRIGHGEEAHGEDGGGRLQHPSGHCQEQDHRGDAGQEGDQAQGRLAPAQRLDHQPHEDEEPDRGPLFVLEGQQQAGEVPSEDVEGQRRLVEGQGAVGEVLGGAKRHPDPRQQPGPTPRPEALRPAPEVEVADGHPG